jgi:hypothetical protein
MRWGGLGWAAGGVSGALVAASAAGATPPGPVFVVLAILVIPLVAFPGSIFRAAIFFFLIRPSLRAWEGKPSSRLAA